jgi:hypothetical protein
MLTALVFVVLRIKHFEAREDRVDISNIRGGGSDGICC